MVDNQIALIFLSSLSLFFLPHPSPQLSSHSMKSIVSLRKSHGRNMAKCPKCGAEQRSDNIDRHLSTCREVPSDAPIRLGNRRSRCPKCKKEMHSNKIRAHIAKCKSVAKPRPHCIDVRGDHATIPTGRYILINSFGEYYLEDDAKRDLKKTGTLHSLTSKPMLKFIYDCDRYALVLCDSAGTVRAKQGKDGVWSVQSKIAGRFGSDWEQNHKLRANWD